MSIEKIMGFIKSTCILFQIDESHGFDHSMKTLLWSLKITKDMTITNHESQVIKIACLLHDMCDKKYMDEMFGAYRIKLFLMDLKLNQLIIEDILFIITTMSYSKVIKNGYPNFDGDESLEKCYHIVRNSDLLESYDPERCIAYHIIRCNGTREEGILKMVDIFETRILRLIENGYINIQSAKEYATKLHDKAITQLETYKLK